MLSMPGSMNLNRDSGPSREYIHIYFLPVERGWVWQIPITDEITSVGVVVEKEVFKQSKTGLEEYFKKHTQMNPDLGKVLQNAQRV